MILIILGWVCFDWLYGTWLVCCLLNFCFAVVTVWFGFLVVLGWTISGVVCLVGGWFIDFGWWLWGGFYDVGLVFILFLVLGFGFRCICWFRGLGVVLCLVGFGWALRLCVVGVICITAGLLGI